MAVLMMLLVLLVVLVVVQVVQGLVVLVALVRLDKDMLVVLALSMELLAQAAEAVLVQSGLMLELLLGVTVVRGLYQILLELL